jgi:hypothetical protein
LIDGFVETNDVVVVTGCTGRIADHWEESISAELNSNGELYRYKDET